MLGLLTPYAASLRSALALGQVYIRYIGTIAPAAAVLFGVAMAGVAGRGRLRLLLGTAGLLVLVLGVVDSALSPVASWRTTAATQPRQLAPFVALGEDGRIVYSHPNTCHAR